MSSQSNDESFSAEEGLKFLTFALRAYQEEYDVEAMTVDRDLLSEIIMQEHELGMNLVIEQDDDRVMIKAVVNETE